MIEGDIRKTFKLPLPQTATDIAEQLNISKEIAEAALNSLRKNEIIKVKGPVITILNIDLLKDVYL
jgi:DNA-binding transcriptional regulator LsrR (DeoR family)